jgi:mono/diheme cytochrome c family protein
MQAKANRRWLWGLAAIAVIVIGVAIFQPAFGGEQAASPAPDVVAVLPEVELVQAEPAPAGMQPAEPPAAEDESGHDMPAADTPSSDNCIACHTNQALLQQLAVEPEEVKSELAGGEG